MRTFNLTNKQIILYGAASIGTLMLPVLEQHGFVVSFFIDKRAKELKSFMNKKVYDLNDDAFKDFNFNNYVVIVSVKNVFEHTNIARKLLEVGFNQIVYRPLSAIEGRGDEVSNKLNDVYSFIEKGSFELINEIPCTDSINDFVLKDNSLIVDKGDYVVANIPLLLLFTDNKERKTPWFNKPVMSLLPHIDLFRFVSGDINYSTERYIKFCIDSASSSEWIKTTDSWKANVIRNRTEIYERMSNSLELEPDFFIRNAPNVVLNESGNYFNLCSGKHRAAFYASLRKKYIPLKICKKDYTTFLRFQMAEKVRKMVCESYPEEIPAPIEHPYFYSYPCRSKEFWFNFMYSVFYNISQNLYNKTGAIDFRRVYISCYLNDLGFVERALFRAGCVVDKIEAPDNPCIKSINELLGVNILKPSCIKTKYDYSIVDLTICKMSDSSINEHLTKTIGKSEETIFLIEKCKRRDLEDKIINLGFEPALFFTSANSGIEYAVIGVSHKRDSNYCKLKTEEVFSLSTTECNESDSIKVLRHIKNLVENDCPDIVVQEVDE